MTSDSDDLALVAALGDRWVRAEIDGDTGTLDALATSDFTLVGPLGFVLDRTQWLDRYRGGDLVTTALIWHETHVRLHGDCAVVVGVHDQEAAYRGQPNNGRFRATHILIRESGDWRLAGIHLSPIAAPPGAGQGAARTAGVAR
jgi:ketosteroid isomerase-like protein